MISHPVIQLVASIADRTPAQVLLRWSIQRGFAPLPKSAHADWIRENAQVFDFELPESSMLLLDALDGGARISWNSSNVP